MQVITRSMQVITHRMQVITHSMRVMTHSMRVMTHSSGNSHLPARRTASSPRCRPYVPAPSLGAPVYGPASRRLSYLLATCHTPHATC